MGKVHERVGRALTLYVRQMAWLHATPKPPPGSRRNGDQVSQLSREDQMKRDGLEPRMPPNPAPHIVSRFIEIGITEATGMGRAPLSWREIEAWQHNTRVMLAPWEARLMRQLSLAYIAEVHKAESENRPPPWQWEITQRERDVEEKRLRMVLG